MNKISVMVVDDSAVMRQVLSELLNKDPGIQVIDVAPDPIIALEKMKHHWPDVIILDIEMPKMDGLTFLRQIMEQHPTPVIICSTLTEKGTRTSLEAMSSGAVSVIAKPTLGLKNFLHQASDKLIHEVKHVSQANVQRLMNKKVGDKFSADVILSPSTPTRSMIKTTEHIVAIGTSTGGTQALEAVLTRLPRVSPGIVIVQHMPEKFTAAFAERLDKMCAMEIREAQNNDRVVQGRALIAPGGKHMLLNRSGAHYFVEVVDGPLVNRHKPSVDVLFRSVAKYAGSNAVGIIMTGMGDDGARGLKEMRDAGSVTLAQDEASCVVYGMPKEAVKLGAAERSISLDQVPHEILKFV